MKENGKRYFYIAALYYMKEYATKCVPLGGDFWEGGVQTFIHKGTNGRWRDILQKDESLKYEQRASEDWVKSVPNGSLQAKYLSINNVNSSDT